MKILGGSYQRSDRKKGGTRGRGRRDFPGVTRSERVGSLHDGSSVSDLNSFRVGRAIAGEARKNTEEKLERIAEHKKAHRRKLTAGIGLAIVAMIVGYCLYNYVAEIERTRAEEMPAANEVVEPTVPIVDENAGQNISRRVKDFVARVEDDAKDHNLKIERVVLPFQRAREIDIYVEGRAEHYKMSVDRDTAVQAEDMAHMVRYLDEKGISCDYVDLRIEGKAYYK